MYADRTQSRACKAPISRRALAHLRAAAGLPRRPRGAQPGNRNRLVHGIYSRAFRIRRERTRVLVRESCELVALVAHAVRARLPSFDKLRMRNSGVEKYQEKVLTLSLSKGEGRLRFYSRQSSTNLSPDRSGGRS